MMAQGTPDGMTKSHHLSPADTQSLIAMKYFIDAQLKSIGKTPEQQNDVASGGFIEKAHSKDASTELDEPVQNMLGIVRSELVTPEHEGDEVTNLVEKAAEYPVVDAPIEETSNQVEESSNSIEDSLESMEGSPNADEFTAKPAIEEATKSLEDTTKTSEKPIEITESVEQVAVTAPVETPDSVGLKTPENAQYETLEVEKDILPKEVVDAADINQDLEMTV